MRSPFAVALFACACGGSPQPVVETPRPRPTPASIEACVRAFVDRQPMRAPDLSVRVVPPVALFEVGYGEGHDCEAGCFRSRAFGVATSCDRIGWLLVSDHEHTSPSELKMFALAPTDTALFDESLWQRDTTRSLARWLAHTPNASDDIRDRATVWLAAQK